MSHEVAVSRDLHQLPLSKTGKERQARKAMCECGVRPVARCTAGLHTYVVLGLMLALILHHLVPTYVRM